MEQFGQINQLRFNHPVDPFAVASHFWTSLSVIPSTSQSSTTIPEVMKSTPAQSDEQRLDKEPSKLPSPNIPIDQGLNHRQHRPDDDGGYHPFPNLRGCKNMRFISMSGELEEPRIIRPIPGYCRVEKPPIGSEMDLVARLVRSIHLCHMPFTAFN